MTKYSVYIVGRENPIEVEADSLESYGSEKDKTFRLRKGPKLVAEFTASAFQGAVMKEAD